MPLQEPNQLQNQYGNSDDISSSGKEASGSADGSFEKMPGVSKRERLSGLTSRTKARTKKLLRIEGPEPSQRDQAENGALKMLDRDPAFRTSALEKKKRFRPGKSAEKVLGGVQTIGNAVVHPKDAVKRGATKTTAGQLSKAERPYLSRKADLQLLEAYDNLQQAESTASSRKGSTDEEQDEIVGRHRDTVKEMEAHREGLQAAWTTSRHVRRVRVVPKRQINFPNNDYFIERDKQGNPSGYDWAKWLGNNILYYTQDFSAQYIDDFNELPFDLDSSRHYLERLLIASAPWQSWAMSVRAIYRWEDPKRTFRWFALYVCLWYTQHMIGFLYCYILYITIKRRYAPTTVQSLRDSLRRALDNRSTAYKFGELVDKHGRSDWLEPLMEHMGPYVQLQLGDMANMLEVFSNFYNWKYPRKTIASLIFFFACLIVSFGADMAFCMKVVWFIVGGAFFFCWPISSLYPKYRYLVSPFKWVLWDIPTNAEWSFQHLRRQAQIAREQLIEQNVEETNLRELARPVANRYAGRIETIPRIHVEHSVYEEDANASDDDGWYSASSTQSVLESHDIRGFRAQYSGSIGRVIVYSRGIRYVCSVPPPRKELWRRDFSDLAEMRKVEGSTVSKVTSLSANQLEIKCIDGSALRLEGMKERDDAFNAIIGFSSLQWQSLQIVKNTKAQA